jgi:biopolymer transport protein ExbB
MSARTSRKLVSRTAASIAVTLLVLPAIAQAWWNNDWKQRTAITLNTSTAGVQTQAAVTGITVPVRLHSGNFDFLSAKPDGSDLRVVAGDDKTPLKFWVERFDSLNELGVLWVQLPSVAPATDKNVFYVYGGNDKAPAQAPDTALFDTATLAAFHFSEKDGIAADQSGTVKASAAVPVEINGLIGPSAHPDGTAALTWPATDKLKAPANGPLSVAVWIKPESVAGTIFSQGPVRIALANGALNAQVGTTTVAGGTITPATWSQVVLTIGSAKATLYVNGAQTGQADIGTQLPAIEGDIHAGAGYQGLLDELEISSTARNPEWIKLAYAAQSADAKLVATKTETSDSAASESGGGGGYFGILFKSLTPDAWVVIAILAVMFVIAVMVMITKALYVNRTEGANRRFLKQFRGANDVLKLDAPSENGKFADSSLYRLYQAGLVELTKRDVGPDGAKLSGASIDAVKAAIDADSVREGYKLNAQMVLLTIAISGGPFLGLLGTVIGVMITFAAIAAAGDVNVNAIAPGIAAALLATVAGLSVAIPALFGYNYLASRIKTISSDMQIFIDEFVTRVAETYGAR